MSTVAAESTSTSLFDWQAKLIERAAGVLAHWVGTTDSTRFDWAPCGEQDCAGRSALAQIQECILVNQMFAAVLRGETLHEGWSEENAPKFATNKEAQEQLVASAQELASAVRSLDEKDLTKQYQTAFGPMPGAVIMELPMANMHYHAGQVNYIQLLYGDKEFSIPPGFTDA